MSEGSRARLESGRVVSCGFGARIATMILGLAALALVGALLTAAAHASRNARGGEGDGRTLTARSRVQDAYAKLPLVFEANQGQLSPRVRFLSRTAGSALLLMDDASAVLAAARDENPAGTVTMRPLRAQPPARIHGDGLLPGKSHYLRGSDPAYWTTDVAQYSRVVYDDVYPGVDLVFHGSHQRQLEYDFVVGPGADPKQIRVGFEGVQGLRMEAGGDLVLKVLGGEIRQKRPVIYQEVSGARVPVEGRFVLRGEREVGFEIDDYDTSRALTIDPVLVYSTYLGGSDLERGQAVAVDVNGNVYVAGWTCSFDFPLERPFQASLDDEYFRYCGIYEDTTMDAFVTKINARGDAIVYSTYLGGSREDRAMGIAVDAQGQAYVGGWTWSVAVDGTAADFPMLNGLPTPQNRGPSSTDGFVTKLNAQGNGLIYSTPVGGSDYEGLTGIAIDGQGHAYAVGTTESIDFPTKQAVQPTSMGFQDAFVAKLAPSGARLLYSTYLGGSLFEQDPSVAVDPLGNAYIAGHTDSIDFPTVNPLQATYHGETDGFVAGLDSRGRFSSPRTLVVPGETASTASPSTGPVAPPSGERRGPRTSQRRQTRSTGHSTRRSSETTPS